MTDWVVVVPSYNRVEIFKKKTLAVLKEYNIPAEKIYVFVANEEQEKLYKEGIDKKDVGHIVVGIKGLPEVRNFIFDYFPKGKALVSFDDDVRGFIELDEKSKGGKRKLKDLAGMFDKGFAECKKIGANFWGVYPVPNPFFMKEAASEDFKFIIGSFWGCFNPKDDVKITIGNGEKEDFQRTIQFWKRDQAIVRLNNVAVQTSTYTTPGGLQEDGKRLEREKKTVKAMLDKWPEYLRLNPHRKSPFPEFRLIRHTRKSEAAKGKKEKGSDKE